MTWYDIAEAEIGQAEIEGAGSNPRIAEYFAGAGHPEVKDDATPWCAAYVGWALREAGIEPSGSLAARSYLRWGKPLELPRKGCIVVLKRGNDPKAGHVGFFAGMAMDKVMILGGNQGDKVSIQAFPESMVLGYRWPEEAPLATSGHELHHVAHQAMEDRSWTYWARGQASKLLAGGSIGGSLLSLASGLSPLDWVLIAVGVVFAAMVALQIWQLKSRNKLLGSRT